MLIRVNPDWLSSLNGEEAFKLLDNIVTIYKVGKTAVEILKSVDYNENPDHVVDYGDLFDLEDILIEKDINISGFGSVDSKDVAKYARNACLYFNEACDLLDIDSCSNTVMDCAEMTAKIKFAVANSCAFLYNTLIDVISYIQYLKNVKDPLISEQTKLQYPDYEDVDVEYAPVVAQILSRECTPEEPDTLIPFVMELLETIKEYPNQNTAILSKYSEYSEFYDLLDSYNQVDIRDATSILMPHDVEHILGVQQSDPSLVESQLEVLSEKLDGRMGAIDGVQSISYYGLDSLVWLAKYCQTQDDYDNLFSNERAICSDLEKCYLCIARENLYSLGNAHSTLSTSNIF